ncbi:hypothetical protein HCN44_002703 [Aphidius gifuensis]|uniref:Venom protein n=1 Tax=Aphidius gifuensis TaxID=684658 RepID=A0A834XUR1_APHGI|nr:hypothetical protein HCN44_002703 [Aphidius gifuensis]
MKLWIVVVVFLFIFHSNAKGNPLGSFPSSNGGFGRQQSQFGESIRDWYRDMKARIFGSNPPDISGITGQTKQASQQQISFLGGFLIDLSKVSFDPQRDWGFRLGNWYIIKKESDSSGASNIRTSTSPAIQEVPDLIENESDDKTRFLSNIPTVVSIDDIISSTTEKTVETSEQNLPEESSNAVDVSTDEIVSSTTEQSTDTTEQNVEEPINVDGVLTDEIISSTTDQFTDTSKPSPAEEPINVDGVLTDEIISSTTEKTVEISEQNLTEESNDADDVPTDEIISSTTEQSINTSEQNPPEKSNADNATITDGSVEIISPK